MPAPTAARADGPLLLLSILGVMVAVMAVAISAQFGAGALGSYLALGIIGTLTLAAVALRSPVSLTALLILASTVQRGVSALAQDPVAQYLDETVWIGICVYTLFALGAQRHRRKAQIVIVVLVLLVLAIAFARAQNVSVGFYQLRQMLIPVSLICFGSLLTLDDIRRIANVAIPIGVVAIAYSLIEIAGMYLIDPTLYVSGAGRVLEIRQNDLPAFYYAWLSDGTRIIRLGGYVLNPPVFGLVLSSLFICGLVPGTRLGIFKIPYLVVLGILIVATVGRGGITLAALALFQPWITRRLGRWAFLIIGAVAAIAVIPEFVSQGASERHVDGLSDGVTYALRNPIGGGFGTGGNNLGSFGLEATAANESFAATFMTAAGLPAILVLAALLIWGIRSGRTLGGAVLTGAVIVSLASETSAGLEASGLLWIIAGTAFGFWSGKGSKAATRDEPPGQGTTPADYPSRAA